MAPTWATALTRITRRVNLWFLRAAGITTAAILAMITYDLVMRNVFDMPTTWVMDIARFALVYVFFLALAPALEGGSHVSVDILDHYLPERWRARLRILALTFLLVFGGFLLWQLWSTAHEAWVDDALFPTVVQVKLVWVFWIGPVGVVEFLLTGLAMLGMTLGEPPARAAATH